MVNEDPTEDSVVDNGDGLLLLGPGDYDVDPVDLTERLGGDAS